MAFNVQCAECSACRVQCTTCTAYSVVFICRENPRRSGIPFFPNRPRCSQYLIEVSAAIGDKIRFAFAAGRHFDFLACYQTYMRWFKSPNEQKSIAYVPDSRNLRFHKSRMITDHRRNFIPNYPRRSWISTSSCFHKLEMSGTVRK